MARGDHIWPLEGEDAGKPSVWLLESGLTYAEIQRHGIYSTREKAEAALMRYQESGRHFSELAITEELLDSPDDL